MATYLMMAIVPFYVIPLFAYASALGEGDGIAVVFKKSVLHTHLSFVKKYVYLTYCKYYKSKL